MQLLAAIVCASYPECVLPTVPSCCTGAMPLSCYCCSSAEDPFDLIQGGFDVGTKNSVGAQNTALSHNIKTSLYRIKGSWALLQQQHNSDANNGKICRHKPAVLQHSAFLLGHVSQLCPSGKQHTHHTSPLAQPSAQAVTQLIAFP